MAWTESKARARIRDDLKSLPSVNVQDLRKLTLDIASDRLLNEETATAKKTEASLVNIPRTRALLADTAQIYVDLLNFDDVRTSSGQDTEADHRKALSFLHLCYTAVDRVIDGSDLQRVDFHDTRVHLVVFAENGGGISYKDVATALRLAAEVQSVIVNAAHEIYSDKFTPVTRCGIDVGQCIAINNGTKSEPEPLFIGPAANNAAKLAMGSEGGIFLSPTVQRLANQELTSGSEVGVYNGFNDPNIMRYMETAFEQRPPATIALTSNSDYIAKIIAERVGGAINSARSYILEQNTENPTQSPEFSFFFKTPPLVDLKFKDLMPSRTVRQNILSIFADICGYTKFIEDCLAEGKAATAVRALYIIRNELRAVLEEDFGGRKLRFIGDCIAGLSSTGTSDAVNVPASIAQGVRIAAAMLSSLEICKQELGDIPQLQLSVGLEIGATPISRIGIRGERSVRVASSLATSEAEEAQRACEPGQMRLGIEARSYLPDGAHDFINESSGIGTLRDYQYVNNALGTAVDEFKPSKPSIVVPRAHVEDTPAAAPARAHLNLK